MKFYTNVSRYGQMLLYRGIENGTRVQRKIKFKPTLFVTSPKGDWTSLDGKQVAPLQFEGMREAKKWVDENSKVAGRDIYGNLRHTFSFINEQFPGNIEFDRSKVNVTTIDIEVASDDGFPEPEDALKEVTAICLKNNIDNTYYVWGRGNYDVNKSIMKTNRVVYKKCDNETELLKDFITHWSTPSHTPDIITGWNTRYFDIPYLVNRINRLIPSEVSKFSPWGMVSAEGGGKILDTRRKGLESSKRTSYDLDGIQHLDYMEIFKKFSYQYGPQESYSLNHISHVVLDEQKLSYDEHKDLHTLYLKDYQKFIDYNIKDVELVDRMEDKLGLITLVLTMAYRGGVNYQDTLGTTAIWDTLIYRDCYENKIAIPLPRRQTKTPYPGGYVKEPMVGMHSNVVSFDLNSLYPSIIMQYNMSPETIADGEFASLDVNKILNNPNVVDNKGKTVAASGQYFNLTRPGVMPKIVANMYADRVKVKNQMLNARRELEAADPSDLQEVYRIERDIARNENEQMTIKLLLNSLYGAMGNQYFRFFDQRIAEAITLTGQLAIQWAEKALNIHLNKILKSDNKDYVIAIDTDSLYVNMDPLVQATNPKDSIEFLDKASLNLEQAIAIAYDDLFNRMGGTVNKMVMKREVIADRGIWTAKKRYVLNVLDNEGVRYTKPKLKIMGIEAIKSSTPEPCREALKQIFSVIMSKDQTAVQQAIEQFKEHFRTLPAHQIAFPRGVTDVKKWSDRDTIYKKATPIHVRGSLLYNNLLSNHDLEKQYELITNGDKMKYIYLKKINPMMENVIGFKDFLPNEFKLDKYIDYDLQFEKAFIDAIEPLLKSVGWTAEKQMNLDLFFN